MNAPPAVAVVIDGRPVPKGRARVTRAGIAYTPAKTRLYEAHGRLAAQMAMGDRPPFAGPLRVAVTAVLPVPASWSGRRRIDALEGRTRPVTKPDADNYLKAALDACAAIVFADDCQAVEATVAKVYGIDPRLEVKVWTWTALKGEQAA